MFVPNLSQRLAGIRGYQAFFHLLYSCGADTQGSQKFIGQTFHLVDLDGLICSDIK